jgi:hypothetical protein
VQSVNKVLCRRYNQRRFSASTVDAVVGLRSGVRSVDLKGLLLDRAEESLQAARRQTCGGVYHSHVYITDCHDP